MTEKPDILISDDLIQMAEDLGACKEALLWLRAQPRTVGSLASVHPAWALWGCKITGWYELLGPERLDRSAREAPSFALEYAAKHLTPERLDQCAKEDPAVALAHAADRLTPDRLDQCAKEFPSGALAYAAPLLTPERLDWCAAIAPWRARHYAAAHLTPERLDWCAAQEKSKHPTREGNPMSPDILIPDDLIQLAEDHGACPESLRWLRAQPRTVDELVAERPAWALWGCKITGWYELLGAERLDQCAKEFPHLALQHAAQYLTPERLDQCAKGYPSFALVYAAQYLTPERLDQCAEEYPKLALQHAAQYLTPERLDYCAKESPAFALAHAAPLLTPATLAACTQQVGSP